jgi:hypothetical protein
MGGFGEAVDLLGVFNSVSGRLNRVMARVAEQIWLSVMLH